MTARSSLLPAASVPVERVRALLRLLSPDHITPLGRRQLEQLLAEYDRPDRPD